MNRISKDILNYITRSDKYRGQVIIKRHAHNNLKDFTNQVGYIIMDVVSREKKFFDINRSDIAIDQIAQELF